MAAITRISPNFTKVEQGKLIVWYSFATAIAFSHEGKLYLRENVWGTTTGKHLNQVSRAEPRMSGEDFEAALKAAELGD